jgi:hypothetical protein
VGIFTYKNGAGVAESVNRAVIRYGGWGEAVDDVSVVAIGPSLYGVMLSGTDGGQGYATTTSYLLAADGGSVSVIWNCVDQEDNEGAYDPTDRYGDHVRQYVSAAYRFVAYSAQSDHYDIQLISRGADRKDRSEALQLEDWTETYRFKDHNYQLLKRTSYREVPKIAKATR